MCKGSRWQLDRAKLELYTSQYSKLHGVDTLYFHDEQEWAVRLLVALVSVRSPDDSMCDWGAAYLDIVTGLPAITSLEAHAHMYAIARRLGMHELRDYACVMFQKYAQIECTQVQVMGDAVIAVYTGTTISADDKVLKDTMVDAWMLGGKQLTKAFGKDGFIHLMAEVPEFVADLHTRMMMGFKTVDSLDRVQHLCNDCGERGSW